MGFVQQAGISWRLHDPEEVSIGPLIDVSHLSRPFFFIYFHQQRQRKPRHHLRQIRVGFQRKHFLDERSFDPRSSYFTHLDAQRHEDAPNRQHHHPADDAVESSHGAAELLAVIAIHAQPQHNDCQPHQRVQRERSVQSDSEDGGAGRWRWGRVEPLHGAEREF